MPETIRQPIKVDTEENGNKIETDRESGHGSESSSRSRRRIVDLLAITNQMFREKRQRKKNYRMTKVADSSGGSLWAGRLEVYNLFFLFVESFLFGGALRKSRYRRNFNLLMMTNKIC